MKNTIKFALVGALLAVAAPVASAADNYNVSKQTAKEVAASPEQVLKIVAQQIAANKGSACEIVKAAIATSEADKKQVAQIVELAIKLVPTDAMKISTCALAVAPDAHVEVMQVTAKFMKKDGDPKAGNAQLGGLFFWFGTEPAQGDTFTISINPLFGFLDRSSNIPGSFFAGFDFGGEIEFMGGSFNAGFGPYGTVTFTSN